MGGTEWMGFDTRGTRRMFCLPEMKFCECWVVGTGAKLVLLSWTSSLVLEKLEAKVGLVLCNSWEF